MLVGVGTFFAQAAATGFVGRAATADRGSASGIYLACYFFGGLVGTAVLGQIFDRFGWAACVGGIALALAAAAYLAIHLQLKSDENADALVTRQTLMSALTPKADSRLRLGCPLCANSGHRPCYSITSSACTSIDGGTVRPSALAVLRLTARSNLVGCSTGISPGFAPRKILSTCSAARRKRSG
jgi:MFS family permease